MALSEDQTASTPPTSSEGNAVVQIAKREDVSPAVEADFMQAALEKGSVEKLPELQENLEQVHVLVRQVYAAAGMEAKISMIESEPERIHVELDTSVELSPEQSAFLTTLKARYEDNKHDIPCHSDVPWSKVEAKLKAYPAKLDTLKKMEDSGGAPDVYKVEGEDFIFGDLSTEAPKGRRNVNYQQAVAQAAEMGAQLMSLEDYRMIGNRLRIDIDIYPQWVWLDTSNRQELLAAGYAISGYQHNCVTHMKHVEVNGHNTNGAFRCSLSV